MLRRLAARARALEADRREDGDAGFTVIELMITSLLLSVVTAILFGALTQLTRSETSTQARAQNEEAVRLVLTQMERDLRAANPVDGFATKAEYATAVQVRPAGDTERIRWVLDGSGNLRREIRDQSGATVLRSQIRLRGVSSPVLFSYWNEVNTNLVTDGAYTNLDVATCVIRIRISLTAAPNRNAPPYSAASDVHLRNRLPGGLGCM